MNGPGGWDGDMPNFPSSPAGGVPAIGDSAFEVLLAGDLPPADAERGLRPLAEAIAALTVPPSAREIAGEADARAAYRGGFTRARGAGTRPARARSAGGRNAGHGRIRLVASVLSVKLVTAGAVAAAVGAGGGDAPVRAASHFLRTGSSYPGRAWPVPRVRGGQGERQRPGEGSGVPQPGGRVRRDSPGEGLLRGGRPPRKGAAWPSGRP
jgi:hypothetical protein